MSFGSLTGHPHSDSFFSLSRKGVGASADIVDLERRVNLNRCTNGGSILPFLVRLLHVRR